MFYFMCLWLVSPFQQRHELLHHIAFEIVVMIVASAKKPLCKRGVLVTALLMAY